MSQSTSAFVIHLRHFHNYLRCVEGCPPFFIDMKSGEKYSLPRESSGGYQCHACTSWIIFKPLLDGLKLKAQQVIFFKDIKNLPKIKRTVTVMIKKRIEDCKKEAQGLKHILIHDYLELKTAAEEEEEEEDEDDSISNSHYNQMLHKFLPSLKVVNYLLGSIFLKVLFWVISFFCPWLDEILENKDVAGNGDFVRESVKEKMRKLSLEISELKEMEIESSSEDEDLKWNIVDMKEVIDLKFQEINVGGVRYLDPRAE